MGFLQAIFHFHHESLEEPGAVNHCGGSNKHGEWKVGLAREQTQRCNLGVRHSSNKNNNQNGLGTGDRW